MPTRNTKKVNTPALERSDAPSAEPPEPEPPDRVSEPGDSDESPTGNYARTAEENTSGPSQTAGSKLDDLSRDLNLFIAYSKQRDEEQRIESRRHEDTLTKLLTQLVGEVKNMGTAQQLSYGAIEGILRRQDNTSARVDLGTDGSSTPDEGQPPRLGESSKGKERAIEHHSQLSRTLRSAQRPDPSVPQTAELTQAPDRVAHATRTVEEEEPSGPHLIPALAVPSGSQYRRASRTLTGESSPPDPSRGNMYEDQGAFEGFWPHDHSNTRRAHFSNQDRGQPRQGTPAENPTLGYNRREATFSRAASREPSREPSQPRHTTLDWRGMANGWGNTGGRGDDPETGPSPWTSFQKRIHDGIERVLQSTLGGPAVTPPSHQFVKTLSASTRPPIYEGEDDLPAFMAQRADHVILPYFTVCIWLRHDKNPHHIQAWDILKF
jgi:hypothetical protein